MGKVKCLICGQGTETVNEAIAIGGIFEDGDRWFGMAYVCSWECWYKFKERAYKKDGEELLFNRAKPLTPEDRGKEI